MQTRERVWENFKVYVKPYFQIWPNSQAFGAGYIHTGCPISTIK